MAIKSQDIKNGTVIRIDGKLQVVVSFLHVKPGKGNTFMRTKLKDVVSGYVTERRFNIGEVTFDQVTIDKKMIIGEEYMKEGDIVEVVSDASTETILTAEMPVKTVLQITYMEPGAKGNTATNTLTKATVETGGTVLVPLFCKEGDKIVVDTRDGSYVERAKE